MKLTSMRIKYVVDQVFRGDAPSYVDSGGILVVNQSCVSPAGLDLSKVKYHDPDQDGKITSWIQRDDILVNSTGTGTLGRVAHVPTEPSEPLFADSHVTIIRGDSSKYSSRFLFYALSIQQDDLVAECSDGATNQIELSRAKFGNKTIAWPSVDNQNKIVKFLDCKTADIDGLISAKQRLLETLAEKRRALITHAVTQGLDPNAPMRDSGIPWLGKIPAHWDVRRARYMFSESNLPVNPDDEIVTCFRDGEVTLRKNRREEGFTNAVLELGYQGIRCGQLILHSMDAFAGAIGVSDSNGKCSPEYIVCDALIKGMNLQYYALLLREMALRNFIQSSCPAVRERAPRIRFNDFKDFFLPIPNQEEQSMVVDSIRSGLTPIDELMQTTKSTLQILQERRTALISAAVTGQLEIS